MDLPQEFVDLVRSAEFTGLREIANDQAISDIINKEDQEGYIPKRHIVSVLALFPATDGLIRWVTQFGNLPPEFGGGPAPFALFCLFCSINRVVDTVIDPPLRATKAQMQQGIQALRKAIPAATPDGFEEAMMAGEMKISRAEKILGRACTPTDIGASR
jgi:hypothetical protein